LNFGFPVYILLFYFFLPDTSYYVEAENGALLREVVWPWKMMLGGYGKVMEEF